MPHSENASPSISTADVIDIIKKSGLRGRGGAGFPTGLKWEIASKNQADQKYVVCNADEGDPGAFMDRSVLEGDPHSVLEAMAICGYAIGASKGLSTSGLNTRWQSNVSRLHSARPANTACWARISSAATSVSTLNSVTAPAHSSAVRRLL